jgi:Flp pilus assembly pilin Flp
MINMLKNLHKEESGQDMVEYGILTGMIATGVIAAVAAIATWVTNAFTTLQTALGA